MRYFDYIHYLYGFLLKKVFTDIEICIIIEIKEVIRYDIKGRLFF